MQPSPKFIFCYVGLFGWELESLVLDALAILALLVSLVLLVLFARHLVLGIASISLMKIGALHI